MHHLVSDGWSIGVFVEELIELYEADVQSRQCRLPPIRIQYADYAEWQRESLDNQELCAPDSILEDAACRHRVTS